MVIDYGSYEWPSASSSSNASVGVNGSTIPSSSTLVAGENPSGNQEPIQTDASGNLLVNVAAGTISAENPSVSLTGSAVPADATYSGMNVGGTLTGLQGTANGLKVDGSAVTQPVSASSLPLPTGASTSALQTTGNTTLSSILSDLTNGTQTTQISGTVPLPTGAATSALQTTGNTTLSTISGKLPASLGQTTESGSLSVTIASDQGAIPTSSPVNSNGSSSTTTVSTVATITKPGNAVGFMLQCDAASSDYIRWCDSGSTASTSSGFVLQPGQDTGFVPMSKNLSICAHSGTQTYNIQWVLSS